MSLKKFALIAAVGSTHHSHKNNNNNNNSSQNNWTTIGHQNINNNNSNNHHHNINYNDTHYLSHLDQQQNNKNYNQGLRIMRPGGSNLHGNVNVLLGGAMLTVVTTIVCLICYCCHRKIKMQSSSSLYRQQRFFENDPNMEIYSVEQYFDTSGLFSDIEPMQSNNNVNNSIHNEPPPSYHEVIANKQKELFAYKNIKSFNECDKHDNDTAAILSPTSNTSSTYEFNQSEHNHNNNHRCRNLNDNNNTNSTVAATGVVTSPCLDLDSDSVLCECTTAINHHFIANFCENCNNLYSNNNNVTLTSCGQQNCFQNQFNYCMDMDQYNNNNIIDQDCCLQQSQTPGQTQEHTLEQNNNNTNDENGNETNSINLNCNGLIRLDMSQIMDHTGLPTYDAAIKLESSGYV